MRGKSRRKAGESGDSAGYEDGCLGAQARAFGCAGAWVVSAGGRLDASKRVGPLGGRSARTSSQACAGVRCLSAQSVGVRTDERLDSRSAGVRA
ncbi:hypothetical protein CRG98_021180 [Punica granatum]|uniref:Uncharacterized protein n=1 Tax=Punica granatum TaxID=22663 RepID=A0A2I0JQ55_PUNGR|nr:hypothetical protein CRG98_021180 [Punica granatum]